jgi:hypothetical protein
MKKFTTILESVEEGILFDKFKKLFEELYDNLLQIVELNISGSPGDYDVDFKTYTRISNSNFEEYNRFLSFLNNLNVDFSIQKDYFYITIKNLEEFITELETIKKSKIYNL